jgi:hypothetical protein
MRLQSLCLFSRTAGRLREEEGIAPDSFPVSRKTFYWVMLAAVVLAALLKARGIGTYSLWCDEITTAVDARQSVSYIIHRFMGNGHPFYTLLAKASILVFGETDATVRLPAVVFSCAALAVGAFFVKWLAGDRVAICYALLAITLPSQVCNGGNARGYSMVVFFSIISMWLMLGALQRPGFLLWAWYGVSVSLLTYSHLLCGGMMAAAEGVFITVYLVVNATRWKFEEVRYRAQIPRMAVGFMVAVGLTALLFSPWWINPSQVKDVGSYSTYVFAPWTAVKHLFLVFHQWTLSSTWYWQLAWIGVIGLGLLRLFAGGMTALSLWILCWVGVPVALNSLVSDIACAEDRYVVYWIPLLLLLASLGLESLPRFFRACSVEKPMRVVQTVCTSPVAVALALAVANLGPALNIACLHLDDWHGAARLIQGFNEKNSLVLMPPNCRLHFALTYYAVPEEKIRSAPFPYTFYDSIYAEAKKRGQTLWIVSRHSMGPAEILSSTYAAEFAPVSSTFFSRISVWCRLPSGPTSPYYKRDLLALAEHAERLMSPDPIKTLMVGEAHFSVRQIKKAAVAYEKAERRLERLLWLDSRFGDPRFGSQLRGLHFWLGIAHRDLAAIYEGPRNDPERAYQYSLEWVARTPSSLPGLRQAGWNAYGAHRTSAAMFFWSRLAKRYEAAGELAEASYHRQKAAALGGMMKGYYQNRARSAWRRSTRFLGGGK